MKTLITATFAIALGACAAQQSSLQSSAPTEAPEAPEATAVAPERREQARAPEPRYVSTIERRDVTGSRINRVRRRSEPVEDTTAGKRVETISRDDLEDLQERGYDGLSEVLPPGD